MTCDFDRIDALVAGELSDDECKTVLAHMKNCPTCRAYYEAMAGLEGEDTVPEGFTQRVMDTVRATPQTKVRRRRPMWQSVAAMAACAALVVGLGLGSGAINAPSAPAEAESNELIRGVEESTQDDFSSYQTQPSDAILPVYTLTNADLCAQVRDWLARQDIPELYPDGPREAYDLTTDQVSALKSEFPLLALPDKMLQLELKSAE